MRVAVLFYGIVQTCNFTLNDQFSYNITIPPHETLDDHFTYKVVTLSFEYHWANCWKIEMRKVDYDNWRLHYRAIFLGFSSSLLLDHIP